MLCLICQRHFPEDDVVRLPCAHNFCQHCYSLIQRYNLRKKHSSSSSPTRSQSPPSDIHQPLAKHAPPNPEHLISALRRSTSARGSSLKGICPLCDVSRQYRKSPYAHSNITTQAPSPLHHQNCFDTAATWRGTQHHNVPSLGAHTSTAASQYVSAQSLTLKHQQILDSFSSRSLELRNFEECLEELELVLKRERSSEDICQVHQQEYQFYMNDRFLCKKCIRLVRGSNLLFGQKIFTMAQVAEQSAAYLKKEKNKLRRLQIDSLREKVETTQSALKSWYKKTKDHVNQQFQILEKLIKRQRKKVLNGVEKLAEKQTTLLREQSAELQKVTTFLKKAMNPTLLTRPFSVLEKQKLANLIKDFTSKIPLFRAKFISTLDEVAETKTTLTHTHAFSKVLSMITLQNKVNSNPVSNSSSPLLFQEQLPSPQLFQNYKTASQYMSNPVSQRQQILTLRSQNDQDPYQVKSTRNANQDTARMFKLEGTGRENRIKLKGCKSRGRMLMEQDGRLTADQEVHEVVRAPFAQRRNFALNECSASVTPQLYPRSRTTTNRMRCSTSSNDKLAALLFPTFSSSSSRKESVSGYDSIISSHEKGSSSFFNIEPHNSPDTNALNTDQIEKIANHQCYESLCSQDSRVMNFFNSSDQDSKLTLMSPLFLPNPVLLRQNPSRRYNQFYNAEEIWNEDPVSQSALL